MLTPPKRIQAELESVRAHRALVFGRLAACTGVAAAAWVLVLCCALAQLGRVHVGLLCARIIAPVCLLGGFVVASRIRRSGTRAWPDKAPMAQKLLRQFAPNLASAVLSALQLGGARPACAAPHSDALVAQHMATTAERLFAVNLTGRWRRAHAATIRTCFWALLTSLILSMLGCAWLGEGRRRLVRALREPEAWRLSQTPLIGDLRLTYTYPGYTQLPERVVEGSDGAIEAVVGSLVDIHIQTVRPVYRAWLEATQGQTTEPDGVPHVVEARQVDKSRLWFTLPLLHDGTWRLIVDLGDGERLGDVALRTLRAVPDAPPHVTMIMPSADVTLRNTNPVLVQWRCDDDFNLDHVNLVIDIAGQPQTTIMLWHRLEDTLVQTQASGSLSWAVASLQLAPGQTAQFHVAATDTDTQAGPNTGASATRNITLFSARAHHEDVIVQCRAALDTLVDTLGFELEAPILAAAAAAAADAEADWAGAQTQLRDAATRTERLEAVFVQLMAALSTDPLAQPQVRQAFENVLTHTAETRTLRHRQRDLLAGTAPAARPQRLAQSSGLQTQHVRHLETDIVYLDDLLAVARIDEIKTLAKDLLTDQRHLKEMLAQLGAQNDPAAQTQLKAGIAALRQKMLDVLRKMSEIKQNLPGEYRNMEASSMLRLDDQLARLDKQLREGDLAQAAEELEQLANMVENMVQNLGEAQKQYGGPRYDAMRAELQHFAEQFKQLEEDQQALSQRSESLLAQHRQKALAKSAKNADDFIKKARQLAYEGLISLDDVGQNSHLATHYEYEIEQARQGLLDLDALLGHQDFLEAHLRAQAAEDDIAALAGRLAAQNIMGDISPALNPAKKACARAAQKADAVATMLAQLFDDADAAASPAQKQQMDAMAQKQRALDAQATALNQDMQHMAEQMPLFGEQSQQSLAQADAQMQSAAQGFGDHALADGAQHSRRAADALGQMRQKLQQATQKSGEGLPLPLGGGTGPGQGEAQGPLDPGQQDDVAIPGAPAKSAGPTFRQDLMEAAKQKAPAYYEEAVRRYYNELIR